MLRLTAIARSWRMARRGHGKLPFPFVLYDFCPSDMTAPAVPKDPTYQCLHLRNFEMER